MRDEPHDWMRSQQSAAIEKVEGYITEIAGTSRLTSSTLSQYREHHYMWGWRIPVDFSDGNRREFHILAKGGFPYIPPRIALANSPSVLTWPHLEEQGHLCILSSEAAVSNEEPVAVVKYLLKEAHKLIEDCIYELNSEDFRKEFLSYWELSANGGSQTYISLFEPSDSSRCVSAWHGQGIRVVGENPESLERWLDRWGAKKNKGIIYLT